MIVAHRHLSSLYQQSSIRDSKKDTRFLKWKPLPVCYHRPLSPNIEKHFLLSLGLIAGINFIGHRLPGLWGFPFAIGVPFVLLGYWWGHKIQKHLDIKEAAC